MPNKNNTLFKVLKTFIIILTLAFTVSLSAQVPPLPGGDDVQDVPIDGGISILIALGGAIYGIKKIRDNKNDSV
jgi:hypothetical protein